MLLRSERVAIRAWTYHDDEVADEWPPYNDPTEPLWNLPRQLGLAADAWSFVDSWSNRRTWAVEDRFGRLVGRISLREIDSRRAQARLGITFGAPQVDLGKLRASLLNVIAEADHITPACQSEAAMAKIGSQDKELFHVRGGHIGMMAGSGAEKNTWPHIEHWLARRSE